MCIWNISCAEIHEQHGLLVQFHISKNCILYTNKNLITISATWLCHNNKQQIPKITCANCKRPNTKEKTSFSLPKGKDAKSPPNRRLCLFSAAMVSPFQTLQIDLCFGTFCVQNQGEMHNYIVSCFLKWTSIISKYTTSTEKSLVYNNQNQWSCP